MRTTLLSSSHALRVSLVTTVIILPLTAVLDVGAYAQRGATTPPTVVQRRPLPAASVKTTAEIVRQATPAVVTVVSLDSSGKTISQGSGFFLRPDGTVLTAWHVLEGASSAQVILQNGAVFNRAGYLIGNSKTDIALLKVSARGVPALEIGDSLPAIGARVITIGSPLGLENTVSEGIVSSIRLVDDRHIVQITAPISPGSSGGPILDGSGRVFAMASATLTNGQQLNFGQPVQDIASLIDREISEKDLGDVFAPRSSPPVVAGHTASSLFGTLADMTKNRAVLPNIFEKQMEQYEIARETNFNVIAVWGGVWRRRDDTGSLRVMVSVPATVSPDYDRFDVTFIPSSEQSMTPALFSSLVARAESTTVGGDDILEVKLPWEHNDVARCGSQTTLFFRVSTGAQLANGVVTLCKR